MREFRVKTHDLASTSLWLLAVLLLIVESLDGALGLLTPWAMIVTAGAVVVTLIDWASRRIAELDVTDAQRIAAINRGLSVLDGQHTANGHRPGHDRV